MKTASAQAAAVIRKELRNSGVKATVKSSSYAGGSSIRVCLENPLPATIKLVEEFVEPYSYATFDGMTDCQGVKNQEFDLPQAGYIFVNSEYSDEIMQAAWDYAKGFFRGLLDGASDSVDGAHRDYDHSRLFRIILNGDEGSFWSYYKPRVKADQLLL